MVRKKIVQIFAKNSLHKRRKTAKQETHVLDKNTVKE